MNCLSPSPSESVPHITSTFRSHRHPFRFKATKHAVRLCECGLRVPQTLLCRLQVCAIYVDHSHCLHVHRICIIRIHCSAKLCRGTLTVFVFVEQSFTDPLVYTPTYTFARSLAHPFTLTHSHSLTTLLAHSHTHSITHLLSPPPRWTQHRSSRVCWISPIGGPLLG